MSILDYLPTTGIYRHLNGTATDAETLAEQQGQMMNGGGSMAGEGMMNDNMPEAQYGPEDAPIMGYAEYLGLTGSGYACPYCLADLSSDSPYCPSCGGATTGSHMQ
jgi:hypothetical protein